MSQHKEVTPFGQFLAILLTNQVTQQSMAGVAKWHSNLIEHVVSNSLWLVIIKTAKNLGLPVNTPEQVEQITKFHLDRLINLGLLIVHGSPEKAAEAFQVSVIDVVERALQLGLKPDCPVSPDAWTALKKGEDGIFALHAKQTKQKSSDLPSNVWQLPSAMFFAELLKAVSELRDEFSQLKKKMTKGNRVQGHANATYLELHYNSALDCLFRYVNDLDLESPQNMQEFLVGSSTFTEMGLENILSFEQRFQIITAAKQTLQRALVLQNIFRSLDVAQDLNKVPDIILSKEPSPWIAGDVISVAAETHWTNNHLFLCVMGITDRFHLKSPSELVEARQKVKANPEEVAQNLMTRFETNLDSEQRNILYKHFLGKAQHDVFPLEDVFVHHTLENTVNVSASDADIFCTGMPVNVIPKSIRESPEEFVFFCETEIFPKINWEKIDSQTFMEYFRAGTLPLDLLLRGLKLADKATKTEVSRLLPAENISLGDFRLLVKNRLLSPKFLLHSDDWRELDAITIEDNLEEIIEGICESSKIDSNWLKKLVTLVNKTDASLTKEILCEPDFVDTLYMILQEGVFNTTENMSLTQDMLKNFACHFSRDLWVRSVLAVYLPLRMADADLILNPIIEDEDDDEPDTTELFEWTDPKGMEKMHFNALKSVGDPAQILKEYSEEEIYRWACQYPKLSLPYDWEEYVARRDYILS